MPIVARCNGAVLVEDGDRLGVAEQGGSWIPVTIFVCGLVGSLLLINGVAMWSIEGPVVSATLLAIGLALLAALVGLIKLRRKKRTAPPPAPWLVFDRATRTVVDESGAVIAPFERLRFERTFQVGSSSRALTMHRHPGKSIVIARGNPFGDSVEGFERAIKRHVG